MIVASSSHRWLFRVTTALAVVAFAVPGMMNLFRAPHIVRDMVHLGYPLYVTTILGIWKLLGAATIALPGHQRLKEWAYAGMIFDLTGAAASRLAVGDGAASILIPLLIAGVVTASWTLRVNPISWKEASL